MIKKALLDIPQSIPENVSFFLRKIQGEPILRLNKEKVESTLIFIMNTMDDALWKQDYSFCDHVYQFVDFPWIKQLLLNPKSEYTKNIPFTLLSTTSQADRSFLPHRERVFEFVRSEVMNHNLFDEFTKNYVDRLK